MHIAILMTNTDESDFSRRHPKDGAKFADLVQGVRPDWRIDSFSVKDGAFPEDISAFDGVIVTGSPASVHDDTPWIPTLIEMIRTAFAAGIPQFGACFGHQAIAVALGGKVGRNPGGWVFGLSETEVAAPTPWTGGLGTRLRQYAAHIEQVTDLPEGATVVTRSDAAPVGGFVIDNSVYTTQNHPEMTHDFIAALVEELADKLGPEVARTARASLARQAQNDLYAETIAQFFEAPR